MNTTQKIARRAIHTAAAPLESYAFTRIMANGVLAQSSGFTTWASAQRHLAELVRTYGVGPHAGGIRAIAMVSTTTWSTGHVEFRSTTWAGEELLEIADFGPNA